MKVGIIINVSSDKQTGKISSENVVYDFNYVDGQNLMQKDGVAEPFFSGNHEQSLPGHFLKLPRAGDAVVVQQAEDGQITWGYLDHYLSLVERRHGSEFKPTKMANVTL